MRMALLHEAEHADVFVYACHVCRSTKLPVGFERFVLGAKPVVEVPKISEKSA